MHAITDLKQVILVNGSPVGVLVDTGKSMRKKGFHKDREKNKRFMGQFVWYGKGYIANYICSPWEVVRAIP